MTDAAALDANPSIRVRLSGGVAALLIACYLFGLPLQREDDSTELYRGVQNIVDWQQGVAKTIAHPRPFPLFQYLSGFVAEWIGRHGIGFDIDRFWAACSLISLSGIVLLFQRIARRADVPGIGTLLTVVLLSGPLLMYARSTFNELVAAFLILAFTSAVTGSSSPVVCMFLCWISGITKETAPPLLALIWLGTLWIDRSKLTRQRLIVQCVAMTLAMTCALATNAGFNLLRYGTALNSEYLSPNFLVHSWLRRLQYSIALWISPNAGVAAFWPTLVIFMIGLTVFAFRSGKSMLPAILAALILGSLTLGLSGWFGPFGFWCWGPRLMLPWLPASALILVKGYPTECMLMVDRSLANHRRFVAVAAITCLCALPHVLAANQPEAVGQFFENDSRFSRESSVIKPDDHYARNVYLAWQKKPPMLFLPAMNPIGLWHAFSCTGFEVALVILLWNCRQAVGVDSLPPDFDGLTAAPPRIQLPSP